MPYTATKPEGMVRVKVKPCRRPNHGGAPKQEGAPRRPLCGIRPPQLGLKITHRSASPLAERMALVMRA
jgi:hypothetical protein